MANGECYHGNPGWCDECAITSARRNELNRELNLASNMTTRQAFAMAAMQGILANPSYIEALFRESPIQSDKNKKEIWVLEKVRFLAYYQADLMTGEKE